MLSTWATQKEQTLRFGMNLLRPLPPGFDLVGFLLI